MAELQERMTHAEFIHWIAKYKRHPFGEVQEDYRFGVIATLLNGVLQSWSRKRLNLPRMEKYFPSLKEMATGDNQQTVEEMIQICRTLAKQFGGRIVKKDGTIEDYGKHRPVSIENHRRPHRGRPGTDQFPKGSAKDG